jgi:DNA-binding LytR/AlgR family response regulator
MKLNCIFIEDELPAMELLRLYSSNVPALEVLGFFNNPLQALNFLAENEVDIVFTDISMPSLSGIDLVKSLRKKPFVVLITGNDSHALDGYELDVIDYLLKPVAFERFMKATNKILNRIDSNNKLLKEQSAEEMDSYSVSSVYVKENGKVIRIDFDEIYVIEGLKDYVKIITPELCIVTHLTMKKLENSILPQSQFLRIHKSFIICISQIRKFDVFDSYVELRNKQQIPVGPQYKEKLMLRLNPVN